MPIHRGPELPYTVVAGVTPWARRWLVATAKVHTATFVPESPQVFDSFVDVLGQYPAYTVVIVNAPIGSVDEGTRTCDVEARRLLGGRRAALQYAPLRSTLAESNPGPYRGLNVMATALLARYREVAAEMSPYRQRVVYEGHPELSFYQLNNEAPLRWSKLREEGREERRALLERRIQGVGKIIDADMPGVPVKHLLDAAALVWTARRVMGRAAKRIPSDAQWDVDGLRMEYVY